LFDRLLRKLTRSGNTAKQLERFFANIPPPKDTGKKVLQYVGISSMYLSPAEILLYHLYQQHGFEVDYLVYGPSVPINEVITRAREENQGKEKFWKKSCLDGQRMLRAADVNFEIIPVPEQATSTVASMPDLDAVLAYEFDGIDFGDIVHGTMYRYFKSLTFGDDAEAVGRRMLVTALSNYLCVKQRCEMHDYDFVSFSHGIYVTWQPVVEYCRRNNVNYVCYDRAKTKDHVNFNVNQPSPDWSFDSAWERFSDRTLTSDENAQVQKYLKDRELQKEDVYSYNFSAKAEDLEKERSRLGIPTDRKCITIFTNLIWDAANVSRDIAFDNAFECVVETIEAFRDRDDLQVVLRSHPAEKVLGTKERYAELVQDHFGANLPSNVTLISPEDDVNSFTVIDITDVGVVNTSTVGLEMAVLGKQVVLISETHYRGKGFTNDVDSPESYFQAIENSLEQPDIGKLRKSLAEKYFFMMMFLYQHRLPVRYEHNTFAGFVVDHFDQLKPDEPLVQIVNALSGELPEDFVFWPNNR